MFPMDRGLFPLLGKPARLMRREAEANAETEANAEMEVEKAQAQAHAQASLMPQEREIPPRSPFFPFLGVLGKLQFWRRSQDTSTSTSSQSAVMHTTHSNDTGKMATKGQDKDKDKGSGGAAQAIQAQAFASTFRPYVSPAPPPHHCLLSHYPTAQTADDSLLHSSHLIL